MYFPQVSPRTERSRDLDVCDCEVLDYDYNASLCMIQQQQDQMSRSSYDTLTTYGGIALRASISRPEGRNNHEQRTMSG